MNPEIAGSRRLVDRIAKKPLLDAPADAVQPFWRALLSNDGFLGSAVSDALHGTWLGHSLHIVVTDIPIGAWTVAAACDVLTLAGVEAGSSSATLSIAIGSAGAAAAALTGWADWQDTKDDPKRLGMLHAMLNGAALTAYLGSLVLRTRGSRGAGMALSFGGFALVGAAAYLGGELSSAMHLGARHTAVPHDPPNEFIAVCGESELVEGELKSVSAADVPVLLSRSQGVISAVAGVCTHRGAPLEQGSLNQGMVTCPWHGARFDVRTGALACGPATFPLASYETRVEDGRIEVRLTT